MIATFRDNKVPNEMVKELYAKPTEPGKKPQRQREKEKEML